MPPSTTTRRPRSGAWTCFTESGCDAMGFHTLRDAKPALLTRTGQAWKQLVTDFDDVIADFKTQVWNPLDEDDVWRGKASAEAAAHAEKMHKQMREYLDEMKPVGKALSTAGEELEIYQARLKSVVNEITNREPAGEWGIDDNGKVTGPDTAQAAVQDYADEINDILSRAETADRDGADAVEKGNVAYDNLTEVLAEERQEERQTAKSAAQLATQPPDELSFEDAKQLNRMLQRH